MVEREQGGLGGVWQQPGGGGRPRAFEVPQLAVFVGERRGQYAVLSRTALGAALRAGLEGVTRVAWPRPLAGRWH